MLINNLPANRVSIRLPDRTNALIIFLGSFKIMNVLNRITRSVIAMIPGIFMQKNTYHIRSKSQDNFFYNV